jgi:dynein light chain LC8-type
MTERKAVIKNADMSEDMQQDAVDCASQALEKYNIEKVSTYRFTSLQVFE